MIYTTSRDDLFTFLFSCLTSFHDYELAVAFSVKTLSVKSNKFFVKWWNEWLMLTKSITDEKILPSKNFTIYEIFWNLFRAFFFTQVAQKYRPSSVRLNIWPTGNTYAGCKIPMLESWANRFFFSILILRHKLQKLTLLM